MKPMLKCLSTVAALMLLSCGAAYAWNAQGQVLCDEGRAPLAGVKVTVVSTTQGVPFSASVNTDGGGNWRVNLPDVSACFHISVDPGPGGSPVNPASGAVDRCTNDQNLVIYQDFIITTPDCGTPPPEGACWLTGGGAKFCPITGTDVGETGKKHNWGGNVNPGCSPTAGDGGSWNDIDAVQKLHFHGTHIEVVRCGNIDDYPPGSTSPATPFNFIEYTGWGTLKGIQGNKVDYGTVYFWARAEDRNEPGSNGQRDGAGKDRYFLNVYTNPGNPTGTSVILVDVDGNPGTVDPLTITDGNMQIHISSCDAPPVSSLGRQLAPPNDQAKTIEVGSWGALKVIYR
jgi:hypothetical protein